MSDMSFLGELASPPPVLRAVRRNMNAESLNGGPVRRNLSERGNSEVLRVFHDKVRGLIGSPSSASSPCFIIIRPFSPTSCYVIPLPNLPFFFLLRAFRHAIGGSGSDGGGHLPGHAHGSFNVLHPFDGMSPQPDLEATSATSTALKERKGEERKEAPWV